jgi:Uma2 family endonuclease
MSEAQVLPVHLSWTFADLEELPDDGYRYEIIDGSLHVSPSPTARHQSIAHLLGVILQDALPNHLRIIPAAGVLRENVDETQYLIPDVLVVHAAAVTDEAKNPRPTDVLLAVEVVSPSSKTHDRVTKRDVYARLGIPSYWLVDSKRPGAILALTLDPSGVYVPAAEAVGDEELEVNQPFPMRITPAALFR